MQGQGYKDNRKSLEPELVKLAAQCFPVRFLAVDGSCLRCSRLRRARRGRGRGCRRRRCWTRARRRTRHSPLCPFLSPFELTGLLWSFNGSKLHLVAGWRKGPTGDLHRDSAALHPGLASFHPGLAKLAKLGSLLQEERKWAGLSELEEDEEEEEEEEATGAPCAPCALCGAAAEGDPGRASHVSKLHLGKVVFACGLCPATSRDWTEGQRELAQHSRKVHPGKAEV